MLQEMPLYTPSHRSSWLLGLILLLQKVSHVELFTLLPTIGCRHCVRPQKTWTIPKQSTKPRKSSWVIQPMSATSSVDSSSVEEDEMDFPWSNFQEWALRDNLPKYVVSIPIAGDTSGKSRLYALWRTLANEVTELSGYDVRFLQKMHQRMVAKKKEATSSKDGDNGNTKDADDREMDVTPDVLPYLDEFEFESNGGVSGRVYGLPGVADGAPVRTPPVSDVETTVILGYTRTDDGSVAYELGTPAGDFYSLDGTGRAASLAAARRLALETIANTASVMEDGGGKAIMAAGSVVNNDETRDLLVNLGGATAILLAGATAVNMLSHHLTVNVFWV